MTHPLTKFHRKPGLRVRQRRCPAIWSLATIVRCRAIYDFCRELEGHRDALIRALAIPALILKEASTGHGN